MRPSRQPTAARATTFLVALALLLGLPQFLVLCTTAGGATHVELSCAGECHCANEETAARDAQVASAAAGENEDQAPGERPEVRRGAPHRVHLALGCDLTPAPTSSNAIPPLAPAIVPSWSFATPRPARRPARGFRESTGPPRPKPVLTEIASTVLLR